MQVLRPPEGRLPDFTSWQALLPHPLSPSLTFPKLAGVGRSCAELLVFVKSRMVNK
jgi:hypothetical protein